MHDGCVSTISGDFVIRAHGGPAFQCATAGSRPWPLAPILSPPTHRTRCVFPHLGGLGNAAVFVRPPCVRLTTAIVPHCNAAILPRCIGFAASTAVPAGKPVTWPSARRFGSGNAAITCENGQARGRFAGDKHRMARSLACSGAMGHAVACLERHNGPTPTQHNGHMLTTTQVPSGPDFSCSYTLIPLTTRG